MIIDWTKPENAKVLAEVAATMPNAKPRHQRRVASRRLRTSSRTLTPPTRAAWSSVATLATVFRRIGFLSLAKAGTHPIRTSSMPG